MINKQTHNMGLDVIGIGEKRRAEREGDSELLPKLTTSCPNNAKPKSEHYPSYLSDMLRSLSGQNAQQHIQEKLIEKAKGKLSATALSISEIGYELGFEHPQSFSKLFKAKTNFSPLEYRAFFN